MPRNSESPDGLSATTDEWFAPLNYPRREGKSGAACPTRGTVAAPRSKTPRSRQARPQHGYQHNIQHCEEDQCGNRPAFFAGCLCRWRRCLHWFFYHLLSMSPLRLAWLRAWLQSPQQHRPDDHANPQRHDGRMNHQPADRQHQAQRQHNRPDT